MLYPLAMGRRALEPGEHGKVTMRGRHPVTGRWASDARLKQEKARPKRWRAEIRYHDPSLHKVRVLTAEGATKGEAESAVTEALAQKKEREGLEAGAGQMTVGRAVKAYLRMLEDGQLNLAPSSVRTYGGLIRTHLLGDASQVRNVPIEHLTALQIETDMWRIANAGAWSQLRHYRAVMTAVLDRAVKAKAIGENPMLGVATPTKPRTAGRRSYKNGSIRRLNRALTTGEEKVLMEQLEKEPTHVHDLVVVMREMGLRIAEAVSLRQEDVDLEAGTLTVAGKLVRVRGEGLHWDPFGKNDLSLRTLPLREGARRALLSRQTAVQALGGAKYLFTTPRGGKPDSDNYNSLLRGVFDRAGLKDVTSHTLRRTVERELELAGATVSERETWMGHTEKVARMHYADHGAVRPELVQLMQ